MLPYKEAFPQLYWLYAASLTIIGVSTATCENAFSFLTRVLKPNRTSMSQKRKKQSCSVGVWEAAYTEYRFRWLSLSLQQQDTSLATVDKLQTLCIFSRHVAVDVSVSIETCEAVSDLRFWNSTHLKLFELTFRLRWNFLFQLTSKFFDSLFDLGLNGKIVLSHSKRKQVHAIAIMTPSITT